MERLRERPFDMSNWTLRSGAVRWEFQSELANKRVLLFVDSNSGPLEVALKGRSSSPTMDDLVKAFCAAEVLSPAFWWVERVPSKSNPADEPSRALCREAARYSEIIFLAKNQWSRGAPRRHPTEHSVSKGGMETEPRELAMSCPWGHPDQSEDQVTTEQADIAQTTSGTKTWCVQFPQSNKSAAEWKQSNLVKIPHLIYSLQCKWHFVGLKTKVTRKVFTRSGSWNRLWNSFGVNDKTPREMILNPLST